MNIYNINEYNLIGDEMTKKYNNIKSIIFPSKKTNIVVICIIFLGLIAGSIFCNIVGVNDKNLVIEKINIFISNINSGSINNFMVLKNSITTNLVYVFLIWILGMTIIGILFNIFLLFMKSFIFGFSISSFILTYSYKGIILSVLYLIFGQLLNIIVISVVVIYSIMFTSKLIGLIFKNNRDNFSKFLKNYFLILIIAIIVSLISSLSESFLLPSLIKMVIKLFI